MSSFVFEAVKNNDVKALKKALKKQVSAENLSGALRNASEKGQIKQIKYLLDAGANDAWAIAAAASFASVDAVRLLYERIGGNLNAALIGAAAHGRSETIRFLLTTPADALDEALADAALRGYSDVVVLLLEKGANPQAKVYGGQTAIELALMRGHQNVAEILEKDMAVVLQKS